MKNEELEVLLDTLIQCGNTMIKIAESLKTSAVNLEAATTPEAAPESIAKDEPVVPTEQTYSFVDVRKAFSEKSHAGFTKQVKDLIAKYGATKLSEVKEESYAALMADLEAIS